MLAALAVCSAPRRAPRESTRGGVALEPAPSHVRASLRLHVPPSSVSTAVLDPRVEVPRPNAELFVSDAEGDAFVAHLPSGWVDADGVARTASGAVTGDYHGCWLNAPGIRPQQAMRHALRDASLMVDLRGGTLVVALSRWSSEFFHFTAELLPRVVLALPLLRRMPDDSFLLIDCGMAMATLGHPTEPPNRSSYMNQVGRSGVPRLSLERSDQAALPPAQSLLLDSHGRAPRPSGPPLSLQTFEMLGIQREQLLCHRRGAVYVNASEVVWPSPTPCGSTQVAPMKRMLRHLPAELRPSPLRQHGRVLLYKRPESRKLTNHDEVLLALRGEVRRWGDAGALGASTPAPWVQTFDGAGSVREQAELFATARCMVGPHGAGMVLMIYAPTSYGTAEVSPGDYGEWTGDEFGAWSGQTGPNHCFRFLSRKLGLRHAWAVMPGVEHDDEMTPSIDDVLTIARDACNANLDLLQGLPAPDDTAAIDEARAAADGADAAAAAAEAAATEASRYAAAAAAAAKDAAAADAAADMATRQLLDVGSRDEFLSRATTRRRVIQQAASISINATAADGGVDSSGGDSDSEPSVAAMRLCLVASGASGADAVALLSPAQLQTRVARRLEAAGAFATTRSDAELAALCIRHLVGGCAAPATVAKTRVGLVQTPARKARVAAVIGPAAWAGDE